MRAGASPTSATEGRRYALRLNVPTAFLPGNQNRYHLGIMQNSGEHTCDVLIIGAGAAGLVTAIFAARECPGRRIVALDGARTLGAKILVAGGGRCNVTNTHVTPADYNGGSRNVIKRVLAAYSVADTIAFFEELGVRLHEEEHGKLFPDSNKARTVLDALLAAAQRARAIVKTNHRVASIERTDDGFRVATNHGEFTARHVVLATGGLSLPKTGSDGAGYAFARALGHTIVPTTPALEPLTLAGDFHTPLSGIAQDVEITVAVRAEKPVRLTGALLWTHFGVSGPVVLNASRHYRRAQLEQRPVTVTLNLLPGETFESVERWLLDTTQSTLRKSLRKLLGERLPTRVADALPGHVDIDPQTELAHFARDARRRLAHALVAWPLQVSGGRGYKYAEVTAGGVPLREIDSATMASRCCPGLYLVGEVLDIDGRIGGFNFQWAWSSAHVAGTALGRSLNA